MLRGQRRNNTNANGGSREVCRLAEKFSNLSSVTMEIHEGIQHVPIMTGINQKKGLR